MIETKIKNATNRAIELLYENLGKLPYFNSTNFDINSKTLKKILSTDEMLPNNMIGLYISKLNALIIDEAKITEDLEEEKLTILILHELLHMASTNRENNTVGFQHESLPITYNEALTQWLTLKIFYGKTTDEILNNNIIYPSSTIMADKMINDIGESVIYNGFFEADIKKNKQLMNSNAKEKWINYILEFSNIYEEQLSKYSMDTFFDKVTSAKK